MANIVPSSNLTVYKDVPLNPDMVHTLDFASKVLQGAYFATKAAFVMRDFTYIRNNGRIRVPLTMEQLITCNYLSYENTSFEGKVFYAFITNIFYINNETTEIEFVEDVFQTWQFDFQLRPCFIEREHVVNDTPGNWLYPEGLELGEYIFTTSQRAGFSNRGYDVVLCLGVYPTSTGWQVFNGYNYTESTVNPMYSGIYFRVVDCTSPTGYNLVNQDIQSLQGAGFSDSILAIITVPHGLFVGGQTVGGVVDGPGRPTNLNSYVPRNKKLLTYPFTYLRVANSEGQEASYLWEHFRNAQSQFRYDCTGTVNFTINMRAVNYRGNALDDQMLTETNFPQAGYVVDTFKAWYAQNNIMFTQARNALNPTYGIGAQRLGLEQQTLSYQRRNALEDAGINALGNVLSGFASGGAVGLLTGAGAGLTNFLGSGYKANRNYNQQTELTNARARINYQALVQEQLAQIEAHQINNVNCVYSGANESVMGARAKDLYFNTVSIRADAAARIDGYFDMYGYKVCIVAIPNTHTRRYWNYVKTLQCDVAGSIPQYAIQTLNSLFDGGITIWHDATAIGNYSLPNDDIGNG